MLKLFPHQERGVEFLRSTPQALLADEMGLGKTAQTLLALENVSPVLVICPASVMEVWKLEAQRWTSREVTLLRGNLNKRREILASLKPDIVVVNYEVVSRLLTELSQHNWQALVLDESHRVKNRKAQVTKAVQALSRAIQRKILLTGTPVLNKPDDLWSQLNILYPNKYKSYWKFVERYCYVRWNGFGWEVGGPKAPEKLRKEIAPFYLRREKAEVLPDLPEKISQQIFVELEGSQLTEYKRMRKELTATLDSGERITSPTVISQLLRLRQICVDPQILVDGPAKPLAGAKAKALVELLEMVGDKKIVIFSQWARVVRAVSKLMESLGVSHVVLDGSVSQNDRVDRIEAFQTDPSIKAFVATIGAGGVGITLTAADTAVFLDKDWTPALNAQAVDRLHRVGQTSTVWVYDLITRHTVEEYVESRLQMKTDWSRQILEERLF